MYFKGILHPERYHGNKKSAPFFEGWYFKLVGRNPADALAVIPGIFKGTSPETTHAFIQILDARNSRMYYYRFPAQDFHGHSDRFEVHIAENRFSNDGIRLQIPRQGDDLPAVAGQVTFDGLRLWPVTLTSPGIMGWYAWMPFMQCYHGVVSMDHGLAGEISLGNATTNLQDGRGYTEKDWGRSFPKSWVWMQCNHFETPDVSFTASLAHIPWLGTSFPGFIVGLWLNGTLYRFTTYTGAKIQKLDISNENIQWTLESKHHLLTIVARRAEGAFLLAPTKTGMTRKIMEVLGTTLTVRLTERRGSGKVLFEESGHAAGLEAVGDLQSLTGKE